MKRARRRFLSQAAAGSLVVACGGARAKAQCIEPGQALPPYRIEGALELDVDGLLAFEYPMEHPCMLVRLREPARGGVGPNNALVAFSAVCPHRGFRLGPDQFKPEHGALGPCPWHNSAFDLKTGGQQIIGQANRHLPRVLLEQRGLEIFAVGVEGNPYALSGM